MSSSYRLKEGESGYGGIDDWEYVEGLGDLDECNGITSEVPGMDEDLYHYHASKVSGSGEIGFPYFILCYSGVPETSNMNQGVQGPGAGMQNGVPGGNNAPPMGKPDCLPPNPPPGRDHYPPDWSDISPCPHGVPGGNNVPPMGKPDCLPPNPPPGRDNYPPDWSELSPCP